jgi:hypothetical protein
VLDVCRHNKLHACVGSGGGAQDLRAYEN